eukprot:UN24753
MERENTREPINNRGSKKDMNKRDYERYQREKKGLRMYDPDSTDTFEEYGDDSSDSMDVPPKRAGAFYPGEPRDRPDIKPWERVHQGRPDAVKARYEKENKLRMNRDKEDDVDPWARNQDPRADQGRKEFEKNRLNRDREDFMPPQDYIDKRKIEREQMRDQEDGRPLRGDPREYQQNLHDKQEQLKKDRADRDNDRIWEREQREKEQEALEKREKERAEKAGKEEQQQRKAEYEQRIKENEQKIKERQQYGQNIKDRQSDNEASPLEYIKQMEREKAQKDDFVNQLNDARRGGDILDPKQKYSKGFEDKKKQQFDQGTMPWDMRNEPNRPKRVEDIRNPDRKNKDFLMFLREVLTLTRFLLN